MRSDLDHLPPAKQRELAHVVQLIFEEFGDAQLLAQGKRKAGRILKLILYGSYARGTWIDEPLTAKGYQSDYDLLVIVNQVELADRGSYWVKAEERLIREMAVTGTLRTPVNFIVHTLQEVNDALAHGRFFFMDIARDGIILYQANDTELHRPKPRKAEEALENAKDYFETWLSSAAEYVRVFDFCIKEGMLKKAAFELHQAVESLYNTVMLTVTFYTPHNHNIAFLRSQADLIDSRLVDVWPRDDRRARALFAKLKDAYVKARYSKHYSITTEELVWLRERVEDLGRVVHIVCSARIDELKEAVRPIQ